MACFNQIHQKDMGLLRRTSDMPLPDWCEKQTGWNGPITLHGKRKPKKNQFQGN